MSRDAVHVHRPEASRLSRRWFFPQRLQTQHHPKQNPSEVFQGRRPADRSVSAETQSRQRPNRTPGEDRAGGRPGHTPRTHGKLRAIMGESWTETGPGRSVEGSATDVPMRPPVTSDQGTKTVFQQKVLEWLEVHTHTNPDTDLTSCTRINSNRVIDLIVKHKTVKPLEGDLGDDGSGAETVAPSVACGSRVPYSLPLFTKHLAMTTSCPRGH